MKRFLPIVGISFLAGFSAMASTIMVVPVHEPLSLHGTDGDQAITDIGEALQASVMPRPMALTGAFPEDLVHAIRTSHRIPTNNPNYKVTEANLLILCDVGLVATLSPEGLQVSFDISKLTIPPDVDLTSRQVLKLALIALRKTLEDYQRPQTQALKVTVTIDGAGEGKKSLTDLGGEFVLGDVP